MHQKGQGHRQCSLISNKSYYSLERELGRAKLTALYNVPAALSTAKFADFPGQFLHFVELIKVTNTCLKCFHLQMEASHIHLVEV